MKNLCHMFYKSNGFMYKLYGLSIRDIFIGIGIKRELPGIIINEKTGHLIGFEIRTTNMNEKLNEFKLKAKEFFAQKQTKIALAAFLVGFVLGHMVGYNG